MRSEDIGVTELLIGEELERRIPKIVHALIFQRYEITNSAITE